MDITVIAAKMLMLFAIMVIGFIANKTGIIDEDANKKFSSLVVNITAPAMILASSEGAATLGSKQDALIVLLVAVSMYVFLGIMSLTVRFLFRIPKGKEGVYRFMIVFGNNAFMGFPVVQAIFGDNALFYGAIFNIPNNIFAYSYGVYLLTKHHKEGGNFNWKNMINPGVISAVTTLLLFLLDIKLPSFAITTFDCVGQITTPLAMIVIGASLANIPLKSVLKDVKVYFYSLYKMIVLPLFIWLIARMVLTNSVVLGVLVIISAMPCATIAVMLSNEYGGDTKTASRYVFVSTILSVITIPIVAYLLFL